MTLMTVYYVYILITIIVFIYNCRNWKFVRITLLYYLIVTFFGYLVIYGSTLEMQSHFDKLMKEGLLTGYPLTFEQIRPNQHTILRTNPSYFPLTIAMFSFFLTFPQSVNRGIHFLPYRTKSPKIIINKTISWYNSIQRILLYIQPALPFVLKTIQGFYIVTEWLFVLITYSGIDSSLHFQKVHDFNLMLIGGFFILFLTGADIYTGQYGIISSSNRRSIKNGLQQIFALMLKVGVVVICIYLFIHLISTLYLPHILQYIFNIKFLGLAILMNIPVSLGLCCICFIFLSKVSGLMLILGKMLAKVITFPIAKLMYWMGFEVSEQPKDKNEFKDFLEFVEKIKEFLMLDNKVSK